MVTALLDPMGAFSYDFASVDQTIALRANEEKV
jgi:hypothetical protein